MVVGHGGGAWWWDMVVGLVKCNPIPKNLQNLCIPKAVFNTKIKAQMYRFLYKK